MRHNVIFDTNVWVSYFINARADYLIDWVIINNIEVFTTDKLVDELKGVLSRPKFKTISLSCR
ncbi:MAG: putative toxin-antitoxin system toxin component, PIN family [Ginsengibacter sp.]